MKEKLVCLMITILLIGNIAYGENLEPSNGQNSMNVEKYTKGYSIEVVGNSKIVVTYSDTMEKEAVIEKNNIYFLNEEEYRMKDRVFTDIKDVETSPDKSKIYFNAKIGAYSQTESIEYSKTGSYFRYDFDTKKVERLYFMFTAPGKEYGTSEQIYKLNVTPNGNLAVQRRSYSIDYNYVLLNEDCEVISLIDSIENVNSVDSVPYVTVEYGKDISDANSTSHFLIYGEKEAKKVQFKKSIKLEANENAHDIKMGENPILLVADKNGSLISNVRNTGYVFKIKMSDLENEFSRAGILFSVMNPPNTKEGLTGWGLSINPGTRTAVLERYLKGELIILKTIDLPEGIDITSKESRVIAKITNSTGYARINLHIDGHTLLRNFPIDEIEDVPESGYFGVRASYSDVEIKDFSAYGLN